MIILETANTVCMFCGTGSNWEKKVLDEIHHDSKEKVIICGKE